eukprot:1193833-Rhodomonas_salina.1
MSKCATEMGTSVKWSGTGALAQSGTGLPDGKILNVSAAPQPLRACLSVRQLRLIMQLRLTWGHIGEANSRTSRDCGTQRLAASIFTILLALATPTTLGVISVCFGNFEPSNLNMPASFAAQLEASASCPALAPGKPHWHITLRHRSSALAGCGGALEGAPSEEVVAREGRCGWSAEELSTSCATSAPSRPGDGAARVHTGCCTRPSSVGPATSRNPERGADSEASDPGAPEAGEYGSWAALMRRAAGAARSLGISSWRP